MVQLARAAMPFASVRVSDPERTLGKVEMGVDGASGT
jgi:hypothetical protein